MTETVPFPEKDKEMRELEVWVSVWVRRRGDKVSGTDFEGVVREGGREGGRDKQTEKVVEERVHGKGMQ